MAAYAAVAGFKGQMELGKTYFGMAIGPIALEIVEKSIKELSWIEESIERMDVRRRMKMKASLEQIPELIEEFDAVFNEHGIVGMEEDLKQHTHSFLERLKKLVNDEGFPILSRPEMVGLSDEFSKLKLNLVVDWDDELPFYFFSLVGMAGIGKTALAKKIFKDLDILEWFDCCAWVTVGRNYRPEEIIRTILAQVDLHETPTEGFQEMVECLKESLEDKRYLIIFDDVWDIQLAQDYLKFLFPNNGNGSRVLLTTRIKHESDDDPFSYHHLRLLNKEESLHLLREKIFDEGTCPPELEKAGKKIAEKCDGLPLTIITVADLLSKAEKTESFWNEVVAQKRHQLFMDAYDEISKLMHHKIVCNMRRDYTYVGG